MEPYGFSAIAAFDRLPFLKIGTLAAGQSSYDRLGGNNDSDNYIVPDPPPVLLDVTGPGTVYRLWFATARETDAVFDDQAQITFEVDGRAYSCILRELFAGTDPSFPTPFVGIAHGGCYCYVPLPFQRSMRISLGNSATTLVFYNVGLHRYAPGTQVNAWRPGVQPDFDAARRVWESNGRRPSPPSWDEVIDDKSLTEPQDLKLPIALLTLEGPRVITSLRLRLNRLPDLLNSVWLRITWDDGRVPGVNAPLSSFFGVGQFQRDDDIREVPAGAPKRGIALGMDEDGWLYCYFPMPFLHRAQVVLESQISGEMPRVDYVITHRPFDADFAQVGYFTTAYSRQFGRDGRGLTLLDVEGSGHLVGVTMSMEGPDTSTQDATFCYYSNPLCFLEGDERLYIDDARAPAIHGTGLEDFFNSGWYFREGPFHAPVHGCATIREVESHAVMAAYRLMLHDVVPFRKNIRFTIEHGPGNDVPVLAWTLAFYYYQPVTRAVLFDQLDLGDAASKETHDYEHPKDVWTGERESTFEGDSNPAVKYGGVGHKGISKFKMRLPPNNDGVIIRRLFDQRIANQRAMVSIDGEDVGVWFRAGGNPGPREDYRWCEDDFLVPARYTRGKQRISVEIKFLSSDFDWNEFKYWVYVLHDNAVDGGARLTSPRSITGSQIGVVSRSNDKLDLLVADEHGSLVPVAWEPSQRTWYVWGNVAGIRVQPGSPVHLISRSADKLDAFVTDVAGRVVTAAWEPGLPGWRAVALGTRMMFGPAGSSLPPLAPKSAVTAVSRLPDHLDIFVIASDGHLYSAAWPGQDGRWTDWFDLGITGFEGLPAYAVARGSGKMDVFLTGRDGNVYIAAFDPASRWSVSNINERLAPGSQVPRLIPRTIVTAVSRSADHLDIFLVGENGRVYTAAWEPAFLFWNGWYALPEPIHGSPGTAVHAISSSPDHIDVFATSVDGRVYTASWPVQDRWASWELVPAPFALQFSPGAPIAAVSRSRYKLDVFAIERGEDSRGRVLTAAWQPGFDSPQPWRGWRTIGY